MDVVCERLTHFLQTCSVVLKPHPQFPSYQPKSGSHHADNNPDIQYKPLVLSNLQPLTHFWELAWP